jgi:flagellar hook-length control protein FliK
MQISAHPIAPVPMPAPSLAGPGGGSAPHQVEDSPFAKMLSAKQDSAQAEPATADSASSEAEPAETKSDAASRAARNARLAKAGATRAPARELAQRAEPAAQAVKPIAGNADTQAVESKDAVEPADTEVTSMDPALAQWLASLNRPTPPLASVPAIDPRTAGDAVVPEGGSVNSALPAVAPKSGHEAPDLRGAKTGGHKTMGLEAAALPDPKTQEAALHAAAVEHPGAQNKLERHAPIDTPAPIALPSVGAATRIESAPAAIALALPTPVASPEFKGALGVQVSVLARDGIQHAQLHLNPAEMGPISVQIALDGTAAQVDFGADSATTRQIIEAGLPELASALREAGFTLSGGGVSQHSRGQAGADGDGGQRGTSQRVDSASDPAPARVTNLRLPLGAVDLYA